MRYLSIFLVLTLLTSCENEEKRDLKSLSGQAEEPQPETIEREKALQNEVDRLNKEINIRSQEKIEKIDKKIRDE